MKNKLLSLTLLTSIAMSNAKAEGFPLYADPITPSHPASDISIPIAIDSDSFSIICTLDNLLNSPVNLSFSAKDNTASTEEIDFDEKLVTPFTSKTLSTNRFHHVLFKNVRINQSPASLTISVTNMDTLTNPDHGLLTNYCKSNTDGTEFNVEKCLESFSIRIDCEAV